MDFGNNHHVFWVVASHLGFDLTELVSEWYWDGAPEVRKGRKIGFSITGVPATKTCFIRCSPGRVSDILGRTSHPHRMGPPFKKRPPTCQQPVGVGGVQCFCLTACETQCVSAWSRRMGQTVEKLG